MQRCALFAALLALAVNGTGSNVTNTSSNTTSHMTSKTTLKQSESTVTIITSKNEGNTKHSSTCKPPDCLLSTMWEMVVIIAGGSSLLVLLSCYMMLACCVCCLKRRLRNLETISNGKAQQDNKTEHRHDQTKAGDVLPETVILLEDVKSNDDKEERVQGELRREPVTEDELQENLAPQNEPATALDVEGDAGKGNAEHSAQNSSPGMPEGSTMKDSQDMSNMPLMV